MPELTLKSCGAASRHLQDHQRIERCDALVAANIPAQVGRAAAGCDPKCGSVAHPLTEEFIPSTYNVRMMAGLTRIDLRLPDELVKKTDILAKLEYKNRTDVIKSALSEYLRRVETTMQLKEKAVESYLDDKLTYNELVVIIGRQNAESVKVSKSLLERSDRIAEDIARG